MITSNLDCGLQDNLHLPGTKKNGADHAPFFLQDYNRGLAAEIRHYSERFLNSYQIAHKLKVDEVTVDKYLNILRS